MQEAATWLKLNSRGDRYCGAFWNGVRYPMIIDRGKPIALHGIELEAPNSRAMNEVGTTNHRKAEMNTRTYINLDRLPRRPLDEIASLVRGLTYGEMLELAEVLWKVQPEGSAVTQENLPELLHCWSKSRSATAHVLEEPRAK